MCRMYSRQSGGGKTCTSDLSPYGYSSSFGQGCKAAVHPDYDGQDICLNRNRPMDEDSDFPDLKAYEARR